MTDPDTELLRARLDLAKGRIKRLEMQIDWCERDHSKIHEENAKLWRVATAAERRMEIWTEETYRELREALDDLRNKS